ncbi:MAG: multidrug MFS transporter [Lachnospiraceae bacterium]|nr:multidrug MFS transporter [Lachnospiraceae bacterium]
MIYLTVGTHDQQFNRLVSCVDELKGSGVIEDDVIIQSGFCDCIIKYCENKKIFAYNEMMDKFSKARIIISHGGPSTIIQALSFGKIPIVVPRSKLYGEHVNDHQIKFCRMLNERQNNIILVENIADLENTILNYDKLAAQKKISEFGNNSKFIEGFQKIVDEL